jgi:prepilin-type N-terminal cleavage/methylation domain-containing protein
MRGRPSAGFTLLEIAVSLAILGIGIVAVMQIFGGSLRLQDRASRETRAVLYARALMDELLIRPEIKNYSEEKPVTAEGFKAKVDVRSAGAAEGLDDKVLDVDIGIGLRVLTVQVAWQDGAGVKTYDIQSMRLAPDDEE